MRWVVRGILMLSIDRLIIQTQHHPAAQLAKIPSNMFPRVRHYDNLPCAPLRKSRIRFDHPPYIIYVPDPAR